MTCVCVWVAESMMDGLLLQVVDCRLCGIAFGDPCPISGGSDAVDWAEYADKARTFPKGRRSASVERLRPGLPDTSLKQTSDMIPWRVWCRNCQ